MSELKTLKDLKEKHENSQSEGCLQVLDFVSWSIYRNYEYKDPQFMEIIKDKIVIKKEVFESLSGPWRLRQGAPFRYTNLSRTYPDKLVSPKVYKNLSVYS